MLQSPSKPALDEEMGRAALKRPLEKLKQTNPNAEISVKRIDSIKSNE